MDGIIKDLKTNPLITLTPDTDIVCSACPHKKLGRCDEYSKVCEYDKRVLLHIWLSFGQKIRYSEFKRLIVENILLQNKLSNVCENCEWYSICSQKAKKYI